MNWEKFWNKTAKQSGDELAQVQRNSPKSVKLTVDNIIKQLDVNSNDTILDVCCGNGLVTNHISKKCNSIIGVDLSENLINFAKEKFSNIPFHQSKAEEIAAVLENQQFDKIYLQFSFQYFDKPNQGEKVINEMLKVLKPNGLLFIGDIPNHQKLWHYYNSFAKRFFYITSKIRGTNRMGKFWKKEELDSICNILNVKGKFITQDESLPYSHYRFDYLIQK